MATEQFELNQAKTFNTAKFLPWVMFSVAALFYCYAYFLRVAPSMMVNEVMQHFEITAGQFGNLVAFYYYAYTPMQLPVGVIIDRYGARLVLASASLICVSGILVFINADNYYMGCLGRFMMGFGAAFGYITVLKIATIWLPPNRFAFAAGMTTAFGMVAAIFTDNYLAHLVEEVGFKDALVSSLVAGFVLCFLTYAIIRNKPNNGEYSTVEEAEKPSFKELFAGVRKILMSRQTWIIGIVGGLLYLPASVYLDLYGIEHLKTTHGLSAKQAAHIMSCVFAGWIIGGPTIGAISDKIKRRRLPLLIASVVAATLIMIIFYVPHLPISLLTGIMFLLGFSCGAHPLVFAMSKESNATKLSGTATATTNFLIMMGGLICQPLVGILLDKHWAGSLMENGQRLYTGADFSFALAVVPIGLVIAILMTSLLKETRCQSLAN